MNKSQNSVQEYISPSIEPVQLSTSTFILYSNGSSGSGELGGGAGGTDGGFGEDSYNGKSL